MKNMQELITTVEKALEKHYIFANVYQHEDLPVIDVDINWGDWKHSHLYADMIVEELGGMLLSTKVTAEDGSDCYSAIHSYIFH